jgi:hypothetical protein
LKYIVKLAKQILSLGIDLRLLYQIRFFPQYLLDRYRWKKAGGKVDSTFMILSDYKSSAGTAKGHYFHQDLLVAGFVCQQNPVRHVDVGSRIDGFVAHVASFREVEVIDIRPLADSEHANITFIKGDFMAPNNLGKTDSLSCLHAIEHFGLGRYTDPIDVLGHEKGIENLVSFLNYGGILYLSFPIGLADEVQFNAHRIFHPCSIFNLISIRDKMSLQRFDYVDDKGTLHLNKKPEDAVGKVKYGCGIYTFKKNRN